MRSARRFGTLLRTAAAAVTVAAAVASCATGDGPTAAPATTNPAGPDEAVDIQAGPDDPETLGQAAASPAAADGSGGAAAANSGADSTAAPSLTEADSPTLDSPATPSLTAAAGESAEPAAPLLAADVSNAPTAAADLDIAPPLGRSAEPDQTTPARVAYPATIRIPSIQVEAPIIKLGLRDDGSLEVPKEPEITGWWQGGSKPGQTGPAVIVGHIDSTTGPAVFYGLRHLQAGDPVHIEREDGSTVTYLVESAERHPKDDFPTLAVYGPTDQPTLRLVTCGGVFDREALSYEDNFIVFATLA